MSGTGVRSMLSAAAATLAALALLPAVTTPAAAAPARPGPATTTTTPATTPATRPLQPDVLIVHVAAHGSRPGDTIRRTAAAAARTAPAARLEVRHRFPALDAYSVAVAPARRAAAVAALYRTPGVTSVEAAPSRTFFDDAPDDPAVPDDPDYPQEQSYLDAVRAPTAWSMQHGSKNVTVAVIDSGVDVTHPDLAGKIVGTYDAHNGGTAVTDEIGHGTFVAGVAAAATDNGIGIAGAGWNTSILAVKVAGPSDSLSLDDEIAGIRWAVAHGAKIINLSLGGPDASSTERSAIEGAIRQGVLVVAAAGNGGSREKQYPAAYPGVLSVGATDPSTGKRAGFSSYGPWVSVGAPGVGIFSTTPLAGSEFFSTHSGYDTGDGTSFSAPLVAGEAALLAAQDPGIAVAQLRNAVVSAAHGYPRQGLGTGQVDFTRAFTYLPPTVSPRSVAVQGGRNEVQLRAHSRAPDVAFTVSGHPVGTLVPVHDGLASVPFGTWGLANGAHVVSALNCSSHGQCGSTPTSRTVHFTNSVPVVDTPAHRGASTGLFTVSATHDGGGGARLYVDGKDAGFDPSSPYSFAVDGSELTDGKHAVQVALCDTSGVLCHGPQSAARTIVTRSLHPSNLSLDLTAISPNHDGLRDSARLSFRLPDAENVHIRTVDAAGTVLRTARLGTLHSGWHAWTWRGRSDGGSTLPDGRYTLELSTSRTAADQRTLEGYAAVVGVVDTHAPHLSGTTGLGQTFYPVRDGYKDGFTPSTHVGSTGRLRLVIQATDGRLVRTLSAYRRAGRHSLTWGGRDRDGRLVAPGDYYWRFTDEDPAGNVGRSAQHVVTVSGKRLSTVTRNAARHGSSFTGAGGTDPCASASRHASAFPTGVRFANGCRPSDGDLAFASYTFDLPRAIVYKHVTLQAFGNSQHRPSELSASLQRTDGGLEIPTYAKVSKPGNHWYSLGGGPGNALVTRYRHVFASVLLDSTYAGRNEFDLGKVRVRVTEVVLR